MWGRMCVCDDPNLCVCVCDERWGRLRLGVAYAQGQQVPTNLFPCYLHAKNEQERVGCRGHSVNRILTSPSLVSFSSTSVWWAVSDSRSRRRMLRSMSPRYGYQYRRFWVVFVMLRSSMPRISSLPEAPRTICMLDSCRFSGVF